MADLTKQPIPALIRSIAIPASIGFFFNTMYNVIDTYFAGLISTQAQAALGISFPVFFVLIALGTGVSTGATALISNALGEKKGKKVIEYSTQAISFALILGIILTATGLFAAPFLFSILGAQDQYLADALSYIRIILLATVFFMLNFTFNAILSSRGDTKSFRNTLIISFFLNLILNPTLMFGWLFFPKLGLSGIAWATFIIQIIGMFYMGYKVSRTGIFCKNCLKHIIPKARPFRDLAYQGFPASLNMMTIALGIFIITYFISDFGTTAVAAYGIATRIEQLVLLPMIGLNIATLALVGQNNGAKKPRRVQKIIKTSLIYGTVVAAGAMTLLLTLGNTLASLFTSDPAVIEISARYLNIAAFIAWTYVVMYIIVSSLQGLKRPMYALWIGLYRQIIAPIIIFYSLITFLGLGLYGIWFGILIVNWSAATFTLIYAKFKIYDKLKQSIALGSF